MEKNINIDFHAHILPGMDHGCADITMALRQLHMAKKAGVDVVIATSHFYPNAETVDAFLLRRKEAMRLLCDKQNFLKTSTPRVLAGAEVLICKGMENMEGLEQLCVEGTNVLLLEMPFSHKWDKGLRDTVLAIKKKEIQIVLAHAERYSHEQVEEFTSRGIPVQINVNSLLPGKRFMKARRFVKEGNVVALGSDIHGLGNQYKCFSTVLKLYGMKAKKIQEKTAELLELGENA